MSLFRKGDFTLNSGQKSRFKIDCDALSDSDLDALAAWISPWLKPFGSVIPIPTGGDAFAAALSAYVSDGPPLIVDDVLTTGRSMERVRSELNEWAQGIVIFARTKPPEWITAIWTREG